MIKEKFFMGYPVEFQKICLIYPPKIKDIISNDKYSIYSKLITTSQEEIEDLITEKGVVLQEQKIPTPLEYLCAIFMTNLEMKKIIEESFSFFIKEEVTILYKEIKIVVGNLKDTLEHTKEVSSLRIIDEDNFFEFQNMVRLALGQKTIDPPNPDEPEKIKLMKAKARYRDRVKAKNGNGIDLITSLSSICCMQVGVNPLNIGELSYVAFNELIQRSQVKEKYDLNIKSLLAGADSKKIKPKYWICNLEKD